GARARPPAAPPLPGPAARGGGLPAPALPAPLGGPRPQASPRGERRGTGQTAPSAAQRRAAPCRRPVPHAWAGLPPGPGRLGRRPPRRPGPPDARPDLVSGRQRAPGLRPEDARGGRATPCPGLLALVAFRPEAAPGHGSPRLDGALASQERRPQGARRAPGARRPHGRVRPRGVLPDGWPPVERSGGGLDPRAALPRVLAPLPWGRGDSAPAARPGGAAPRSRPRLARPLAVRG